MAPDLPLGPDREHRVGGDEDEEEEEPRAEERADQHEEGPGDLDGGELRDEVGHEVPLLPAGNEQGGAEQGGGEEGGREEPHQRSVSPTTMSIDPMIATESASIVPGIISPRIERLQKEGPRTRQRREIFPPSLTM